MKTKYLKYAFFVLAPLLAVSCKKDDTNYYLKDQQTTVELPIAAHAGAQQFDSDGFKYTVADTLSATPQPLTTTVLLSTLKTLGKSLTVTLLVDPNAVAKLNANHRAQYTADSLTAIKDTTDLPDPTSYQYQQYQMLPTAAYQIVSNSVTIPAGATTVKYVVNVNSSLLTGASNYMLPVTIQDAQGTKISYYKTVYYIFTFVSKYEGDYSANGSLAFPDPTSNRSWQDRDKPLTTVNGNTVRAEAADLGGSGYYMNLTVNADNTVTVKPAADAANQTIRNNGACTYDPSSHTFTLSYMYTGGTGNRLISETLTRN